MIYFFVRWCLAAPVVRFILRPKLINKSNIPMNGGAVLAANHIYAGDTWPVAILVRRRIYIPGRASLFTATNPAGRMLAAILRFAGIVPIDTGGGSSAHGSLSQLEGVLQTGQLVAIWPEGTRSPDGRMYRFHTGVARLALTAGVPVVPLACINTKLRHGFLGLPTLRDARYIFGAPLDFSDYFGRQDDPAAIRWVTDQIAATIQTMTGQTYVDVYARDIKSGKMTLDQANSYVLAHPGAGVGRPPINSAGASRDVKDAT